MKIDEIKEKAAPVCRELGVRRLDVFGSVARASRLGERSRGVVDPGAASCALILGTMAGSITALLGGSTTS